MELFNEAEALVELNEALVVEYVRNERLG